LAAAGLCPSPEARSTRPAGEQGDPRCRWCDGSALHHLKDEAPTSTLKKAPRNQITQYWRACMLQMITPPRRHDGVHCETSFSLPPSKTSTRKHRDWFDDNDADISNLLAEKNGLHKAYMDRRTDAIEAAFFRCHCLVKQRLRETQDARLRKSKGMLTAME
uniref:NAM-associated domain-containing protein n=1 Tax=Schistocephalus solidus TaxID=70667 RepID=A0A183TUA9_SCHSO